MSDSTNSKEPELVEVLDSVPGWPFPRSPPALESVSHDLKTSKDDELHPWTGVVALLVFLGLEFCASMLTVSRKEDFVFQTRSAVARWPLTSLENSSNSCSSSNGFESPSLYMLSPALAYGGIQRRSDGDGGGASNPIAVMVVSVLG